jgi:penicillin-binding protein 2
LAAHILGYIGKINQRELKKVKKGEYDSKDMIGKDGLENSIEGLLRGEDGNKKVEVDTSGRLTGEVGMVASEPGNNVYLTIDIKLQEAAEKALEDTITKIRNGSYPDRFADTKAGSVVAVDIKTGQILALANYPSYDPSVFVKGVSAENWQALMTDDQKPMFNRAVAGTYSPGSTFKMVTAMAALGEGKVTTGETIRDLGEYRRYKYAGKPPACWLWNSRHSTHGLVNVSEALKVSCNYFFYEMGYRTGIGAINKYAQTFGLGSKTGIELPGEKAGILAGPDYRKTVNLRWYDGDTLSASIGQSDYSFTPVQMANYIATLVNGGTKNKLTLINKVTTWDGSQVSAETVESVLQEKLGEEYNTKPINTTFNQSYVSAIFEGMKSVTGDAGGTAYGTFVNYPVKVAGKTGTAQIRGRYKDGTKKSDNAWFVGFAPYENPQIAVVVIIEHGGHGAYTAPVAKEIFSQYFGIKKPEPPKKEAAKTTQVPPKKKDIQSAQKKNKKDLTVQTEKIDSDVQINQNAPADSTNQDGQTDQNTLQNNFINQD